MSCAKKQTRRCCCLLASALLWCQFVALTAFTPTAVSRRSRRSRRSSPSGSEPPFLLRGWETSIGGHGHLDELVLPRSEEAKRTALEGPARSIHPPPPSPPPPPPPPIAAASAAAASPRALSRVTSRADRKEAKKTRSFRRRAAPITKGQRAALRTLWPKFGLSMEYNESGWDLPSLFGGEAKYVVFDIGFGRGESIVGMSAAQSDWRFVGCEVHRPALAACLQALRDRGAQEGEGEVGRGQEQEEEKAEETGAGDNDNVRVCSGDAIAVLMDHIQDDSLSRAHVFFPDPFPTTPERRLVRPLLLELLAARTRHGGHLHIATDDDAYKAHIEEVMGQQQQEKQLVIQQQERQEQSVLQAEVKWRWEGGKLDERPAWRPVTTYEEKARQEGRTVADYSYTLSKR